MAEPQSLPAMVRARYPGVYDDLSDQELDTRVRSKFPGVYDDIPKPSAAAQSSTAPAAMQPSWLNRRMESAQGVPVGASTSDIVASLKGKSLLDIPAEQARIAQGARLMPSVGGMVGGSVGGVPGAVVGGAVGNAVKQVVQRGQGDPTAPATMGGQAKEMLTAGATQGALEGVGEGMAWGAGKLAKWLMNRATSRVTAKLANDFPELSDTLIDNALTVSQGGYDKARTLLRVAKGKATTALKAAEQTGATVPVELTPELADSLKTAILEHAVKSGAVPASSGAVSLATSRLDAPTKALIAQIEQAAEGGTIDLTPTVADLFKTQLQRESRAFYTNRIAVNGLKAMPAEATLKAEFASRVNDAIDAIASGYKAGNAEAQPLVGAVRGLKQAIRPSGNLLQAMVRPGMGALLGGAAGAREGHPIVGAVAGAAMTSPAGMSREAILLAHPVIRGILQQLPRASAAALTVFLRETAPGLLQGGSGPTPTPPVGGTTR